MKIKRSELDSLKEVLYRQTQSFEGELATAKYSAQSLAASDALRGSVKTAIHNELNRYNIPLLQGYVDYSNLLYTEFENVIFDFESTVGESSPRAVINSDALSSLKQSVDCLFNSIVSDMDAADGFYGDISDLVSVSAPNRDSLSQAVEESKQSLIETESRLSNFNSKSVSSELGAILLNQNSGLRKVSSMVALTNPYHNPRAQAIYRSPHFKKTAAGHHKKVNSLAREYFQKNNPKVAFMAEGKDIDQLQKLRHSIIQKASFSDRIFASTKLSKEDREELAYFQSKVDEMNLDEINSCFDYVNDYYPGYSYNVKEGSLEGLKKDYVLKRYYALESQEAVSVRSPDFMKEYTTYINRTGRNPFTGLYATENQKYVAKNYESVKGWSEGAGTVSAFVGPFLMSKGFSFLEKWKTPVSSPSSARGAVRVTKRGQSFKDSGKSAYLAKGKSLIPEGEKWSFRYGNIPRMNNVYSSSVDVAELTMSKTVKNHANDIIKRGKYMGDKARPYIDTEGLNLLLEEITEAKEPVKDKFLPNGLRWDVEGAFNGRKEGIWELVIDMDKKQIVHFNFINK